MHKISYYLINSITLYRLLAAPVLVFIIFYGKYDLFKWLLALSFFTDLIDGTLARKFKVSSVFGSRLDSVADDLTVLAGMIGLIVFHPDFLMQELTLIAILLVLFAVQNILALAKYKKVSSFHTYGAKAAAILQGVFLILFFFMKEPAYILFYSMTALTALELIEEIILVFYLPQWESNVKGLYWVIKRKEEKT